MREGEQQGAGFEVGHEDGYAFVAAELGASRGWPSLAKLAPSACTPWRRHGEAARCRNEAALLRRPKKGDEA